MISHKIKKLPRNSTQIDVTVPWKDIQEEYKKTFELVKAEFEMKGYRKGKVPTELAEKNIPHDAVYEQMIRAFMPKIYEQLIKEENLKPIISPRIDLKKAKENEDWEIEFKLAEKPEIKLKKYKEAIKKAKSEVKPVDIWVPGKDKTQSPEQEQKAKADNDQRVLNSVLNALLNEVECEVSDLVIEEELNQRLSRLVDDIQKLGLTTDQYLKSKNLTMDGLKKQYTKELEEMYKMEFVLMAIADEEKISIEQADLDKLFTSISDPKEKIEAQKNAYFYASILRKQKTLDYLTNL